MRSLAGSGVGEMQRARMLRSAVAVVSEHGYGQMSVARVTGRARVSRRTFYDIFADREDCFLAVFDDALARVSGLIVAAYEGERGPWRERVRAGLAALLEFLDEEPAVGSLLVVDALGAGPRVLRRRAEVLQRAGRALDEGGSRSTRTVDGRAELTGEGVVGAVLSVIHTRLSAERPSSLLELLSPLMGTIVLPYLGPAAARREIARRGTRTFSSGRKNPADRSKIGQQSPTRLAESASLRDPLADVPMRLTYRTLRALSAIGEQPGVSNREASLAAGVFDQGQISKLLGRLERLGLIENTAAGRDRQHPSGEPNAWRLTELGEGVRCAIHQISDERPEERGR
jgi:AcrR family transcriptional regulator